MPAPHITPEQLLQHQDWLFRLVRGLVKDDFTADDMVQATMVEALASEDAGRSNLRAWLGSTARRLTAQSWRSDYRRQEREAKVAIADEAVLEQSSDLTELFSVANKALGDLPESERVVIMLRHMQGWKSERVASELNIPVERVYRDTERGCQKLRDRLQSKYGKEWKASCIAILGIPLRREAAAAFGSVAAGIAACLALAGLGLWFSGTFSEEAPVTELASVSLMPNEPRQLEAFAASEDLPGVDRSDLPPPSQAASGYPILVVGPNGEPVPNVGLEAGFQDGRTFLTTATRLYTTDHAGAALVSLPMEYYMQSLFVQADKLFSQPLYDAKFERGVPFEVQLTQGTIPASFQTTPAQEGIVFRVSSDQGRTGYCTTDSNGLAEILLPHPGQYRISPKPSPKNFDTLRFHVLGNGMERPMLIPYNNLSTYSLLAVDALSGEPITHAKFFLRWRGHDENNRILEPTERVLDSARGLLNFSNPLDPSQIYTIRLEADGYQGCFPSLVEDASQTWSVPMHRMEEVRASLTLDQNRSLVFVEKIQGLPNLKFPPPQDPYSYQKWRRAQAFPLQILAPQTVLFPRVVNGESANFTMHAVDDLGQHWYSKEITSAEAAGAQPTFAMTALVQDETTFRFHGAPSPGLDSIYSLHQSPTIPNQSDLRLLPDENGVATKGTTVGNTWTINYLGSDMSFSVRSPQPSATLNPSFDLTLAPRQSVLHGTVLDADGNPFPDAMVRSKSLAGLHASGPTSLDISNPVLKMNVLDGVIHAEQVFAGSYEIKVTYDGFSFTGMASTEADFVLQAPCTNQFLLQVRASESLAPLASELMYRRHEAKFPGSSARGDAATGHLTAYVLATTDLGQMFIRAKGRQPQLLSNFLDGTPQFVDLEPGRRVRLNFAELGVVSNPQAHWTLAAWGGDLDPRHQSIFQNTERISIDGVPLVDSKFIERFENGDETGRTIMVFEDGSSQVYAP